MLSNRGMIAYIFFNIHKIEYYIKKEYTKIFCSISAIKTVCRKGEEITPNNDHYFLIVVLCNLFYYLTNTSVVSLFF